MFYQILKGVETCFMVANDDLEGKTTRFTANLQSAGISNLW